MCGQSIGKRHPTVKFAFSLEVLVSCLVLRRSFFSGLTSSSFLPELDTMLSSISETGFSIVDAAERRRAPTNEIKNQLFQQPLSEFKQKYSTREENCVFLAEVLFLS